MQASSRPHPHSSGGKKIWRRLIIMVLTGILTVGGLAFEPPGMSRATAQETDSLSGAIIHQEQLLPQGDGSWVMTGRQGRLTIQWPSDAAVLQVTLPAEGPLLNVSDGFEAVITDIGPAEVIQKIRPLSATQPKTLHLELYAEPGLTSQPLIKEMTLEEKSSVSSPRIQALDATGAERPPVIITGGGYGHRVGMSQWGAQGLALQGVSYKNIIKHYYPGSDVVKRYDDATQTVRVSLQSLKDFRKSWTNIEEKTTWTLIAPSGAEIQDASGKSLATLTAGQKYNLTYLKDTGYRFEPVTDSQASETTGSPSSIQLNQTTLLLKPKSGSYVELWVTAVHPKQPAAGSVDAKRFYEGTLELKASLIQGSDRGEISFTNLVNLRQYLTGVVPRESYASWSENALRAQTIAARTYAARKGFGLDKLLVDTTSDQVFGGKYGIHDIQKPYAAKIDNVVASTNGEVALINNQLVTTTYSSSNGGWIESNDAVWSSSPVSYLQARKDQYKLPSGKTIVPEEVATYNSQTKQYGPHSRYRWEVKLDPQVIESKWPEIGTFQKLVVVKRTPGMGAAQVELTGTKGKLTISGTDFRSKIGNSVLYSTLIVPPVYSNELAGADRYETSVAIARQGWPNGAATVVLARGDLTVDALAGSVLAKQHDAPLLLTKPDALPDKVKEEIARLKPQTVYLLGSQVAISTAIEDQLKAAGYTVIRLAGENRVETALAVAEAIQEKAGTPVRELFIATGDEKSPDALAIGPYAANQLIPILLQQGTSLHPSILSYLEKHPVEKVTLVGGEVAIPKTVEEALKNKITAVTRINGSDRYHTSILIAKTYQLPTTQIYFARGDLFADALAGTALAAKMPAPIILVKNQEVPASIQQWLSQEVTTVGQFTYLGGPQAISLSVRQALEKIALNITK